MSQAQADSSKYYLPHNSYLPILGSVALFCLMAGAVSYLNDWAGGYALLPGAILLASMFFLWFGTVINENQHGVYNLEVDRSFRMGMMWFIFSEVMFFAAFFGALFYARQFSVPWVGGLGVKIGEQAVPVAAVLARLADQRPGASGSASRRHFRDRAGLRLAGPQHGDPAARAASR